VSRELQNDTEQALNQNFVNYRILLYLDWPTGEFRIWNGYGDIEVGGNTYKGTGDLIKFDMPTEDASVIAGSASFSLYIDNDVIDTGLLSASLDQPYAGRKAEVKIGLFDKDLNLQGDYYTWWNGILSDDDIEDFVEGVLLTINCEGGLGDVLRTRNLRYTAQSQASLYPGQTDKFLDFVETQQTQDIQW